VTEHQRLATLAEVEHGLTGVLATLLADPARWILVLRVDASHNRYLQLLAYEDGSVWAEATSNVNLQGDDTLTVDQQTRLVELGWKLPDPSASPNFYRDDAEPEIREVAERAMTTLREVFGVRDRDWLTIRLFRSRLWEPTPEAQERELTLGSRCTRQSRHSDVHRESHDHS